MKQQSIMRYLHMGCGESLAASRKNLCRKLDQTIKTSQKQTADKKNSGRNDNESGR